MADLDSFFDNARARAVLRDIAEQNNRLMPCGDGRLATHMMRRGLVRLVDPKRREFTTAFVLTDTGEQAAEKYT